MNVHQSEKQIKDLLVEGRRSSSGKNPNHTRRVNFPGVYVISRSLTDKGLMKIGEAHGSGGIINRVIGQYKICLPIKSEEFYLRYVVITPRKTEGKKHYSQIMESKILDAMDLGVKDSYSDEYIFSNDDKHVEKKMVGVLDQSEEYFTTAIKFIETGFHVYEKNKGFSTPIQDFNSLPALNIAINALLQLRKGKQKASAANILTSMKNSNVVQATAVNPTPAIVLPGRPPSSTRPKRATKIPAKLRDSVPPKKTKKKSGFWEYFADWKKKNPTVLHVQALKDAGEAWRARN